MEAKLDPDAMLAELRMLLASVLDRDELTITDEANFMTDLGVDSIMTLEILVALERKYSIKLPEKDLARLTNLRSVHQLLIEKQAAKK
ncbi:MAG: acyl carrier protein [Acidiferrobacterales bacterium]